jgi:hypothetical protein
MSRLRLAYLTTAFAALALPAEGANLLVDNSWPMAKAQEAFANLIRKDLVHEITIDADTIRVTADHPTDTEQTVDYSWDQSEVRRSGSFVNFSALGMGGTKPFALDQLQFDKLPAVKAAAIAAYATPGSRIVEIEASQPTTRTSKKLLPLWEVSLTGSGNDTATGWVTALGQVVDVDLPQGTTPAAALGPWLAPATVENTLARLADEFGSDAKFLEIMIDDSKALITMEDPQNPGDAAEFYMDAEKITRSSSGMNMPNPFAPTLDRAFTLADLDSLDAARLTDLEARTIARMERSDMTVFRYTISRNTLFMTPEDDRLLVEVRAEAPDQFTGGRVAYDMDGNEADVVLP